MNNYQVSFQYVIDIEADNEHEAEEYAYAFFTEKLINNGLSSHDFPATTVSIS